ncbi:MAG: ferritin family protein [Candidatus Omnitrophica bacterium]|nr:ferritin family protein [Candidatus Omnitrophota bacterium]
MDIFDQAMKIEQEGRFLYSAFARDAADEGAVYVFSWLADQEKKHYDAFKAMKAASPVSFKNDTLFKTVLSVFSTWKDARIKLNVNPTQVDLYRKALATEEDSIRLYEEGARTAHNDAMKAVFLQIAAEEKAHRHVMENIIEFVTKPDTWAENAEFGYRAEEYYL